MPEWLPDLNRRLINPVQRLWAPYLPPFALVTHTGRKSGTEYRTPVLASRHRDRIAIALAYGSETQWVKNVLAADGATLTRMGKRFSIISPRIVVDAAPGELPSLMRRVSQRMGVLTGDLSPLS